jgi:hypothetical protein
LHDERIGGAQREVGNLFGRDCALGGDRFGLGDRRLPNSLPRHQRFFRQELQLEIRRRSIGSHPDLPSDLFEPQHLNLDRPCAIRQLREMEHPLLIGGGDDLLITLACGHCGAGKSETASFDRTMVFGSHQPGDGKTRGNQAP